LLQNSNRLSEDAAKKAALEDFFGKSKGGKWGAGSFHKPTAAAALKQQGEKLLKNINPDFKFVKLPTENEWTRKLGTPDLWTRDYHVEWLKIKWLSTKSLSTEDLKTPDLRVKWGKVVSSRVKWLKTTGVKRIFERAIKG
jgi:hypothetical protein